jgi:hypothetical protein
MRSSGVREIGLEEPVRLCLRPASCRRRDVPPAEQRAKPGRYQPRLLASTPNWRRQPVICRGYDCFHGCREPSPSRCGSAGPLDLGSVAWGRAAGRATDGLNDGNLCPRFAVRHHPSETLDVATGHHLDSCCGHSGMRGGGAGCRWAQSGRGAEHHPLAGGRCRTTIGPLAVFAGLCARSERQLDRRLDRQEERRWRYPILHSEQRHRWDRPRYPSPNPDPGFQAVCRAKTRHMGW